MKAVDAIICRIIWPAVRFAARRTPRARGRTRRLIDSITTRAGIKAGGVDSGTRWATVRRGYKRRPVTTVANQRGNANPRLTDSWVVGVKV